jgi:hypothetical protein
MFLEPLDRPTLLEILSRGTSILLAHWRLTSHLLRTYTRLYGLHGPVLVGVCRTESYRTVQRQRHISGSVDRLLPPRNGDVG